MSLMQLLQCKAIVMLIQLKSMLQRKQVGILVLRLLQQIKNCQQFRDYYQGQSKKGIFGVIKNSFDEMLIQLQKFTPNSSNKGQSMKKIYEVLRANQKVWAYYEFKMFAWIVAWLQFQKTNHRHFDIHDSYDLLQSMFINKPLVFLKYEYALLISKNERQQKCKWDQAQIESFSKIIQEQNQSKPDQSEIINWKLISLRLFAQQDFFKSPNQCRERWRNHLNPKLNKRKWELSEDLRLMLIYKQAGSRWAYISRKLKNRTEHMVKNRFNSLRHKWMGSKKSSAIFNINNLIRDIENNLKASNQDVVIKEIEEIEEQPIVKVEYTEQIVSEDPQNLNDSSSNHVKSEEESQVYQESSVNQGPSLLSLVDVGGEPVADYRHEKVENIDEELVSRRRCYEMLLDDPLWKNNDRISTSDYDWLDDMMEKKNIQQLNEYI